MNKSILLQSIKSVSGFLAIFLLVIYAIALGLQYYPMVTIPVLMLSVFSWMVWLEYKNRKDLHNIRVQKRIKDIIK